MKPLDLRDRPIVVTGASSGIGAATAQACAREGMPVLVSARRGDRLDEVVAQIRDAGGRAEAVAADIAEDDTGRRIVERCAELFGPPHAVFANAGYGYRAAHAETDPAEVRDIFNVNLFGSLRVIDAALPGMIERGSGHVLVCSSCLALLPTPYYGAYSATKAAQHHIVSAMRAELRPRGVSVSVVYPIGTRTEFSARAAERRGARAGAPGRWSQSPERVAGAVVRALKKPRPEVWTSTVARLGFALSAPFPGLRDRVLISLGRRS